MSCEQKSKQQIRQQPTQAHEKATAAKQRARHQPTPSLKENTHNDTHNSKKATAHQNAAANNKNIQKPCETVQNNK